MNEIIPYLLSIGSIPSTIHRVARPSDRTKTSYRIAIFFHPRPDVVLAHGITELDFLSFRMQENYTPQISK